MKYFGEALLRPLAYAGYAVLGGTCPLCPLYTPLRQSTVVLPIGAQASCYLMSYSVGTRKWAMKALNESCAVTYIQLYLTILYGSRKLMNKYSI